MNVNNTIKIKQTHGEEDNITNCKKISDNTDLQRLQVSKCKTKTLTTLTLFKELKNNNGKCNKGMETQKLHN